MPAEPVLVTVPGIQLCTVGTWPASTGEWTCTADDIDSAIQAAADPHVRSAIVKLGHRKTWADSEGQPALGRIQNLRASADGMTLIGDLVGVPAWLAKILPSAFPSRSVECAHEVITASGSRHGMVLTAIALLGETDPAVDCLDELEALFTSPPDEIVAAVTAAMSEEPPMPKTVQASTNMEDVRRAYYDAQPTGSWAWVREVWSDFLIVDDDDAGLWRVPWSEGTDGAVTFGQPEPVKTEYVPDGDREQQVALLSRRPVDRDPELVVRASAFHAGRRIRAGSDPSQPVPAPAATNPKEAGMSPEQLEKYRTQLGLPAEASEADVEAAIDAKLAPPAVDPAAAPPTDPDPAPADGPTQVEAGKLPEGWVAVPKATLEQMQVEAGKGATAHETLRKQGRDTYLHGAVAAGKFAPAQLKHMEALYDADEAGTRKLLDGLPANLIPTVAAGHDADPTDTPEDDRLLGELAAMGSNIVQLPTRSA